MDLLNVLKKLLLGWQRVLLLELLRLLDGVTLLTHGNWDRLNWHLITTLRNGTSSPKIALN